MFWTIDVDLQERDMDKKKEVPLCRCRTRAWIVDVMDDALLDRPPVIVCTCVVQISEARGERKS